MKYVISVIVTLFFSFPVFCQSTAGETDSLKTKVKIAAAKLSELFIAKDFNAYVEYVHPKVVAMMGGKMQMIRFLEKSVDDMKNQGVSFLAMDIGVPDQMIILPTGYQCVVPQTLVLKTVDGKLVSKSNLLAVSADKGVTWYFIDTGGKSLEEIQKVIPELSSKIVLSPNPKPFFYRD
jgi:hypothetical protein